MTTNTIQLRKTDFLRTAYKTFKEEGMLPEELTTLHFLQGCDPEMASAFMAALKKGRRGILQRLAGSLLREDVMGIHTNSYDLYVVGSAYALNVPAIDEYWQKIIERLYTYRLKSGTSYKLFPLSEEECLVIPVSRTYAFNRVEVDGTMLHMAKEEVRTIDHAVELLELMRQSEKAHIKSQQHSWAQLAEELTNGSANLALSYAYWSQKKKELQKKAAKHGISSSLDWVLLQKKQTPLFDSSLFFEQLSVEGHNLHPGAKTKLGMQPNDVFRYAPEFDGTAPIQFVGIHHKHAEWSAVKGTPNSANDILFQEYPELQSAVEQQFKKTNLSVRDYVFVPVHPWQMEHAIPDIYRQEIKDGIVVPVDGVSIPCGATSSFRTVVPLRKGEAHKLAIKVAVNSQMTSTVRSISANTTNNAPVFTRLVRFIMQQEPELAKTFVPVCEYAGFNFKVTEKEGHIKTQTLKSRNLSAVLRENIETFISQNELAIVGSSLFAQSPISEKPVLAELIEKYSEEHPEITLRQAAFQFLSEYASIALPGFLTLMVKYGVGLEGHLQNSVMVFQNGRPARLLFRDWGGSRIYGARLEECGFKEPFYPGSVTVTSCLSDMHNKMFYTVLQNHCGELVLQISKNFGLREEELWQEIYRICEAVFVQLESIPEHAEKVKLDREALYREAADHKALTKMRLQPESKGYVYAAVPNPLFKFAQKDKEK